MFVCLFVFGLYVTIILQHVPVIRNDLQHIKSAGCGSHRYIYVSTERIVVFTELEKSKFKKFCLPVVLVLDTYVVDPWGISKMGSN